MLMPKRTKFRKQMKGRNRGKSFRGNSISFGTKGKKYELGTKKHHDHLICTKCDTIIEFYDDTIEDQQEMIAKRFDFEMTGHTMKIVGICKKCQNVK